LREDRPVENEGPRVFLQPTPGFGRAGGHTDRRGGAAESEAAQIVPEHGSYFWVVVSNQNFLGTWSALMSAHARSSRQSLILTAKHAPAAERDHRENPGLSARDTRTIDTRFRLCKLRRIRKRTLASAICAKGLCLELAE